MKLVLFSATLGVLVTTQLSAQLPKPPNSSELVKRADSLMRLDPAKELARALAKKDLRFIAVCTYACLPSGVSSKDPFGPLSPRQLRKIEGTTDAVGNPNVARLNKVATSYATRYNKLLLLELRKRATLK